MKHVSNQRCFNLNVLGDMNLTGCLPFDAQGDWMNLEGESQVQHQTLHPVQFHAQFGRNLQIVSARKPDSADVPSSDGTESGQCKR